MSRQVCWERLVLQGFGCYRQRVEVVLQNGLNHTVAANEQGKSTLVAGLAAVLFGLPNSSDPAKFGKARYRNWEESETFRGEVEFSVNGKRYRVSRDFNTDRVSLDQQAGNDWRLLTGGEHRTRARRRNATYEETLADLIGLASPDLFWSTFCIGQPLPEPAQLNQQVQQLLSGSGTSAAQALKKIEKMLEEITRYTGQLGVTGRDKNKDRELENRLREREALAQAIKDSEASVHQQQVLQDELAAQEEEKRRITAALTQKQSLFEAWSRWRHLRDRYAAAVQEQLKLSQAQQKANELNAQREQITEEIDRVYPEFSEAGPEVEAELEELIRVEDDLTRRQNELQKNETEIKHLEQEISELEQRLTGELAAGAGRPHLVKDHQELCRIQQQLTELEHSLAALEQQEAEARQTLAGLPNWALLGDKPLAYYRQAAQAARQRYTDLKKLQEQLASRQEELKSNYRVLEEADADFRAVCRDYPGLKAKLEQQLTEACSIERQAADQVAELQAEQENLARQYADLADLPESAIELIDEYLARETEKQALTEKIHSEPVSRPGQGLMIAGLGLTVAGAVGWGMDLYLILSLVLLGAGLFLGIYGWMIGRRKVPSQYQPQLDRVMAELAEINTRLGQLAGRSLSELAATRERLKSRAERQRELSKRAEKMPSAAQLNQYRARVAAAESQLADFRQRLQPILRLGEEPAAFYHRWYRLKEQAADLAEQLDTLAQKYFGAKSEQIDALSLATEGWPEVKLLATVQEQHLENVGAAAAWLATLTDDDWQRWAEEVECSQKAQEVLRTCAIKRESLEKPASDGRRPQQVLEAALAKLRAAIYPLTEATPPAEVEQLANRCQEAERELRLKKAAVASKRNSWEEQTRELKEQQAKRDALARQLAVILTAAGGDAGQAKARWQQWQQRINRRKELAASLDGLLRGWGVPDLANLALKVLDAGNTAAQVRQEWQGLVDARPGLPSLAIVDQWETLETEYAQLGQSLGKMQKQQQELDIKIFELTKELNGLYGRKMINIAAARERIAELDQECARLQLEAEALAMAHQELATARDHFNSTHRERLAAAASNYFQTMTQNVGRQVILDEEFKVCVLESDEQRVEVAQLSQGAQDQLQIALRLAIADLLAGDYQLPLVFDDPFLNFDRERLAELRGTLTRLAEERQILVLSHQEDYREWGRPIKLDSAI
ncbi:MAG: AAA family ATPase [Bacillota bacterium]